MRSESDPNRTFSSLGGHTRIRGKSRRPDCLLSCKMYVDGELHVIANIDRLQELRRRLRGGATFVATLALLAAWDMDAKTFAEDANPSKPAGWIDKSPHRSAFVEGDGVRLNYLDWGGSGPPLVMIHGIANSPHIFDDLAPLLTDHFRVLAYARRGHGQSDAPAGPYDSEVLVSDLRHLLDNLGIERAYLLGWSMGGDEITEFAGRYPDRVEKLVYLEGGYDWSDPKFFGPFMDILAVNSADPAVLRSLGDLRTWYHAAWVGSDVQWTSALEAFLRDAVRIDDNGAVSPVPSVKVFEALLHTLGTWRRDYTKVRAPALALYGTAFFPMDCSDVVLAQKLREFERNVMQPFRRASMDRIRRELPNVRVEEISDRNHMSIGVLTPDALAASIHEFLFSPTGK
jgi:pimeloyl-ACP methyl ester carboxylesterase